MSGVDRRKVLAQLAAGAVSVPCARPPGPYAEWFPNVVVRTHEGSRALFYDDLLRGRTVLVHCMTIAEEARCRVVANLVQVQRLLGERMGREVFFYSLTVEPERDSVEALRAFAELHGAGPGWRFLTAETAVVGALRGRLFAHGVHGHGGAPAEDCSLGLMRYGNEAAGLWGAVPARAAPEQIAQRLEWVRTRGAAPVGEGGESGFRRAGPRRRPEAEDTWEGEG